MGIQIRNPESMSEKEKRISDEILKVLDKLLDELKSKNLIRTDFKGGEVKIIDIIKNVDRTSEVYNVVINLFKPENSERIEKIIKADVEFTRENLPYLWVSTAIESFLSNAELFKNIFLFILKKDRQFRSNMTLGLFLDVLERISPEAVAEIKKLVDVDLRNALAHRLFVIKRDSFIYFKDIDLKNAEEIKLGEFLIKAKNHNIITQTLIYLVAQKVRSGFFK